MKTWRKRAAIFPLALFICLTACAKQGEDYVEYKDIVDTFPIQAQPVEKNPQQAAQSNLYAVFHTSAGDITVMLYPKESPEEVARFRRQVSQGLYDGQQFVYVRRNGIIECDNVEKEAAAQDSGDAFHAENEAAKPDGNASPQEEDGRTAYSDKLHHYYGAVGISNENDGGGDRLHFVVEQSKPEDERLVPANLYMNELINQRMAELNSLEIAMSKEELAEFEKELNEEISAIGTKGVPAEYEEKYRAAKEMYEQVGGQWALDYQYPVIGQIVEGLNVADAISQAKVSASNRRPKQEIVIEYVEIMEK